MPDHDILIIEDPAPSEPMTAEQKAMLAEWYAQFIGRLGISAVVEERSVPWCPKDLLDISSHPRG